MTYETPLISADVLTQDVAVWSRLIQTLQDANNVSLARREAVRLTDYFKSLSALLETEEQPGAFHPGPETIAKVFTGLAARTRNTMLSQVIVMPQFAAAADRQAVFSQRRGYYKEYYIADKIMTFGFLDVAAKGAGTYRCAKTLPYQLLDRGVMESLMPHDPASLMRHYQNIIDFANHDPLHHLTLPFVVGHGSGREISSTANMDYETFALWHKDMPRSYGAASYEDWAHILHEKVMTSAASREMVDAFRADLKAFFVELARLGDDMAAAGRTVDDLRPDIHYMGMVAAHAVSRVFPLNHPVMSECLAHVAATDPDPSRALTDCAGQLMNGAESVAGLHDREILHAIKNKVIAAVVDEKGIISACTASGIKLFPAESVMPSYEQLKLLELIAVSRSDVFPHVPENTPLRQQAVRYAADALKLAADITHPKTVRQLSIA